MRGNSKFAKDDVLGNVSLAVDVNAKEFNSYLLNRILKN
jgi:hypothetical protein